MGTIGLTLVVAGAALAVIVITFAWGASRATDMLVGEKHRQLEEITTTGDVPKHWRRGNDRRVRRMKARKADPGKLHEVQDSAKRDYLSRLEKLERYAASSPLVADEETRQLLLARLADARALWEARPAQEL